eukprot:6177083-Pleurochrysis_carterae.AAC.2
MLAYLGHTLKGTCMPPDRQSPPHSELQFAQLVHSMRDTFEAQFAASSSCRAAYNRLAVQPIIILPCSLESSCRASYSLVAVQPSIVLPSSLYSSYRAAHVNVASPTCAQDRSLPTSSRPLQAVKREEGEAQEGQG